MRLTMVVFMMTFGVFILVWMIVIVAVTDIVSVIIFHVDMLTYLIKKCTALCIAFYRNISCRSYCAYNLTL